ncbi:hypothetical protein E4U53_006666 [Claviceps sorghi]|nr:hypothetical protein E4U53_006666 [Claviceps sorghi]
MDSRVPMILPKGILVNTTTIYQEVASYSVVPAAKIWEYWHVYTTTNKKLRDPTARRLENFWWQVWGSDRRFLSGRELARIYENISVGHSFVPLRGPPNRWEGPDVPPLTRQLIVTHLNGGHGFAQNRLEPPPMKANHVSSRNPSSSALKPPPSHPILKKSRSPLVAGGGGPRPTARFASPPPESDHEQTRVDGISLSGSTASAGSETTSIRPTKKLPGTNQKRRTASTVLTPSSSSSMATATATRTGTIPPATKRPALHRKCSPRISTAVLAVPRARPSPKEPLPEAQTQNRRKAPIPECSAGAAGAAGAITRFESRESNQGNGTQPFAQSSRSPKLSAKAEGKQPAVDRTASNDLFGMSRLASRQTLPAAVSSHSSSLAQNTRELRSPVSNRSMSLTRTDTDNSSATNSIPDSSSMMIRSMTQNGFGRRPSVQSLFTSATATTTNVAAQGQIIDQAGSLPVSSIFSQQGGVVGADLASRRSNTSLVDSRMLPTQPSPVASVPMGRTRSQLRLLLEREKSRVSDKSRFRI